MQRRIAALKNAHGLWVTGMYAADVDNHESALLSALVPMPKRWRLARRTSDACSAPWRTTRRTGSTCSPCRSRCRARQRTRRKCPMPTTETRPSPDNSLRAPERRAEPASAFTAARVPDLFRIALVRSVRGPGLPRPRKTDDSRLSKHMRSVYIPVSRSQGQMLYLIARSIEARRIVEFGTSFGISALPRCRREGQRRRRPFVGSEIEPSKHAKAEEHLREASLDRFADVRLGDAMKTLADIQEHRSTWCLLDGWKDPVPAEILELLKPKLRPRAVVLADNILHLPQGKLRPYVAYVQSETNGFVSSTLDISDGFELSVFTG